MKFSSNINILSGMVACFLAVTPAYSQTTIPSTADPGRLLGNEQQTLPQAQTRIDSKPARSSSVLNYQPPAPEENSFTLTSTTFQGNTVLSDAALQTALQLYLNRKVSINTLRQLASHLTTLYRQEGYILSSVTVPPQEIRAGAVLFNVRERGLSNITIEATPRLQKLAIVQRIKQILLAENPLKIDVLERALLNLNNYAGVEASSLLNATDTGDIELIITMKQHRFSGLAKIDNRNSRFVGPWVGTALANINGIFGGLDQLSLTGLQSADTDELSALGIDYEMPLGSNGLELTLSAFQLWSEPGFTLRNLEIENTSHRLMALLSYPLERSRSTNTQLYGGLLAFEAESESFDILVSEDRLRVLHLGLTHDWADARDGVSIIQTEVHQGIPALGAVENGDSNLTRQNGKVDFTRFTVYAARTQGLTDHLQLFTAVNGQYSLDQLLSSEEFGYGGAQFGRGYDPSELAGDHGLAGLIELRHTSYAPPLPHTDYLQAFISYDYGAVWRRDGTTRASHQTGTSGAIGLRSRLLDNVTLEAMIAKPFTRGVSAISDTESDNEPRTYFNMTVSW